MRSSNNGDGDGDTSDVEMEIDSPMTPANPPPGQGSPLAGFEAQPHGIGGGGADADSILQRLDHAYGGAANSRQPNLGGGLEEAKLTDIFSSLSSSSPGGSRFLANDAVGAEGGVGIAADEYGNNRCDGDWGGRGGEGRGSVPCLPPSVATWQVQEHLQSMVLMLKQRLGSQVPFEAVEGEVQVFVSFPVSCFSVCVTLP